MDRFLRKDMSQKSVIASQISAIGDDGDNHCDNDEARMPNM